MRMTTSIQMDLQFQNGAAKARTMSTRRCSRERLVLVRKSLSIRGMGRTIIVENRRFTLHPIHGGLPSCRPP